MTEPVNLFAVAVEGDPADPPGYRNRTARLGESLGATRLGGTVWSSTRREHLPYHYENTEEEWLYVLNGSPILRDPDASTSSSPATSSASSRAPRAATR